ncbi:MAG: hypothetical protein QXP59_03990 [Saccharolobus sp.]
MSSEGELFVTEDIAQEVEKKYKDSKEMKDLKAKALSVSGGKTDEFYYETDDFPDTNDFAEFPDSGTIRIYAEKDKTFEKVYIGEVYYEIDFDETWAWESERDPIDMDYTDPIKSVTVELTVYN